MLGDLFLGEKKRCKQVSKLQNIALRVLSQDCSYFVSERNWTLRLGTNQNNEIGYPSLK
jgi:hypothetical protein